MSWEKIKKSNFTNQEVAEQVLQVYTKSLQDQKSLKSILSEYSVLDYFGKVFYGREKVSSHLIFNLHGSNYELSSLSSNDQPSLVDWNPIHNSNYKLEEDLGVDVISSPKLTFPSLTFTTPVRNYSQPRKRTSSEESIDSNINFKIPKIETKGEQSSSTKKSDEDNSAKNMHFSPQTSQTMFPNDIKYLTAYGTIRYPKRVLPTMDPKRIKHYNLEMLRDRFCQLFIGFECDEHFISVTNCKIWTIKYSISCRVTPRNLLKSFNEVEFINNNNNNNNNNNSNEVDYEG